MPVSATENKHIAKQWIDELKPKRVLDIGVGEGTYSDLARTPDQHWYGIEAYYPYVDRYNLEGKYDEVVIGDARYISYSKLGNFDLIICGDMIEHMRKEEAKELIQTWLNRSKHLLLCFPVIHLDQHIDENPFEDHIDHWSYDEMKNYLDDKVEASINGKIIAYFMVKGNL